MRRKPSCTAAPGCAGVGTWCPATGSSGVERRTSCSSVPGFDQPPARLGRAGSGENPMHLFANDAQRQGAAPYRISARRHRAAGKEASKKFGTTDAHRCTPMGRSAAGSLTAGTLRPNLRQPCRCGGHCRIGVHRWCQISCLLPARASPGKTPCTRNSAAPQTQQPGTSGVSRRRSAANVRQDPIHQFRVSLGDAQSPPAENETSMRQRGGGRCGTPCQGTARAARLAAGAAPARQLQEPMHQKRLPDRHCHGLARSEMRRW